MKHYFYLILFFCSVNLCSISSDDFGQVMQGLQVAQGIYNDFKTITSNGIDIDSSLNDFEKDNRYELLFNNYINSYSMKNRKLSEMNSESYDTFRDTYKTVEEGLKIYLNKSRTDLQNEWSKSSSPADYIIEKVHEALFVINLKHQDQKIFILIDNFKNNIAQFLLNYEQDQANVKNILNTLIDLENKVAGLPTIEKKLFDDFIMKKDKTDKEQYEFFNIILSGQAILEYKNNIYKDKKKILDDVFLKINQLISDINVLIKKKNDLLLTSKPIFKYTAENTLSQGAKNNNTIKNILSEMNVIITTGSKSPGKTSQIIPFMGMIEGGKSGGFKGAMEGFGQSWKNLGKKVGDFFKKIF